MAFISVEEALNIIESEACLNRTEQVSVFDCCGRTAAEEIVSDPAEAQVIVSDKAADFEKARTGSGDPEWIRSFDFERILALMN